MKRKRRKQLRPSSNDLTDLDEIDVEIKPLVDAMNDDLTDTLSSCCGHGEDDAYVDIAVHGIPGVRALVKKLNVVEHALRVDGRAYIDASLNWSEEVATACEFDSFSSWVMFSIAVRFHDGEHSSFVDVLSLVTSTWKSGK